MELLDIKMVISAIKFRKNQTQKEIASQIGVKPTYLSDVISGRLPFSDSLRDKLYEQYSDVIEQDIVRNEEKTTNEDSEQNIIIPISAWNVIQKQADSLSSRDKQIDDLISILKDQQQEMKKIVAQVEDRVIYADAK